MNAAAKRGVEERQLRNPARDELSDAWQGAVKACANTMTKIEAYDDRIEVRRGIISHIGLLLCQRVESALDAEFSECS